MAERAMNQSPAIWWSAAFSAQQAVEKAIKGLLEWVEIAFPRTHDVAALIDLYPAFRNDAAFEDAALLSQWAVLGRYPGPHDDPGETEARRLVALAADMIRFVRLEAEKQGLRSE